MPIGRCNRRAATRNSRDRQGPGAGAVAIDTTEAGPARGPGRILKTRTMQLVDDTLAAPEPPTAVIRKPVTGSGRLGNTWTLLTPAIGSLVVWSIVPTALTLWFAFQGYNLMSPPKGFVGFSNFYFLLTDPGLPTVLFNTVLLIAAPLALTICLGTALALAYADVFYGRGIARLLVIAPFFVMPTVSALVWKNLLMHPVYGLFAGISRTFGFTPVDWFADWPLVSIIMIVTWEWTPFATLIILTSLQSLDREQLEAALLDGARAFATFIYIIVPHLARTLAVVAMIETIFFLGIYAEIAVTTVGGPGMETTNLPFFIYSRALLGFDVGGASAGGILAIVMANIVMIVFVRTVARQL
jgi:sorbitol/mannitol transport system permease protein